MPFVIMRSDGVYAKVLRSGDVKNRPVIKIASWESNNPRSKKTSKFASREAAQYAIDQLPIGGSYEIVEI